MPGVGWGVSVLHRMIACRTGGPWIILDGVCGTGTRQLLNRLHLHPQTGIEETPDGAYRLHRGSDQLLLTPLGSGTTNLESSWYCPQFGVKYSNPVLTWAGTQPLDAWCGWFLSWQELEEPPILEVENQQPVVHWKEADSLKNWRFPSVIFLINFTVYEIRGLIVTELNLACVVGARPNFMKMAPLLRALEAWPDVKTLLIHTGQHYDPNLSDVFFEELEMKRPDISLEVGSASHGVQTARILERMEQVFLEAAERGEAIHRAGSGW